VMSACTACTAWPVVPSQHRTLKGPVLFVLHHHPVALHNQPNVSSFLASNSSEIPLLSSSPSRGLQATKSREQVDALSTHLSRAVASFFLLNYSAYQRCSSETQTSLSPQSSITITSAHRCRTFLKNSHLRTRIFPPRAPFSECIASFSRAVKETSRFSSFPAANRCQLTAHSTTATPG
jgi:hypothetical protein